MKKTYIILLLVSAIFLEARHIYVTRHGQVGYPVKAISETRLTELGIKQAQQLGRYLTGTRKFNGVIYASPFYRTTETALYTAELLHKKVLLEPGIQEIAQAPKPSPRGMTLKEINGYFPGKTLPGKRFADNWRLCGETSQMRFQRVSRALEAILKEEKGDILLVGHGASVNDLVKALNNKRPSRKVKPAKGTVWNCSLFIFELNEKEDVINAEYTTAFMKKEELTNNLKKEKTPRKNSR